MNVNDTDKSGHPAAPRIWAGLDLSRPAVMGILNVTPDSFSDGGRLRTPSEAIDRGRSIADAGAKIIDIGGESTRPGALPVAPAEEQRRILPVIESLAASGLVVSVDTRNAGTMRAALNAGATIVNDISALAHDPEAIDLVAEYGCPVILMHMRGTPATMNRFAVYGDVAGEVRQELQQRVAAAVAAGIAPDRIALDPGIGFAKRAEHAIALLRALPSLAALGHPLLVGVSRKSFIGRIAEQPDPTRRLGGSLAATLFALANGASILRAHDVLETVQAIRVWQALAE